jgi:DNA-binding GntR family transcriptional regulator
MLKKISQPETLADRAYREIKQAIIQSRFLPGDPLPEETIASMLGISRTPLRNAIARLAYDGLVELETGKIARVAMVSQKDCEDFLKLRKVLEVFSVTEAVPFVTADFIKNLEEMMAEQKTALEKKDFYSYIELDFQFHVAIAQISQNQKLHDFIQQINNQLHRYLILSGTLEDSAYQANLEHLEIIEALKEKDAAKAAEAMKKHIENVEKRANMMKEELL